MSVRTRRTRTPASESQLSFDTRQRESLETFTDSDIEDVLFTETANKPAKLLNFPTITGLGLLGLGMLHLVLSIFGSGFPSPFLTVLAALAGVFIFVEGLRGRSKRKRRRRKTSKQRKRRDRSSSDHSVSLSKPIRANNESKILGVCAHLSERYGIDVSLVRLAFAVGAIITVWIVPVAYFVLSLVIRDSDKH